MKKSGCDDCRIVMVTSHAHHYAPKFDTARIQPQYNTADSYDQIDCYGNSKLYQVLNELHHPYDLFTNYI